jgi:hypothetical protein
MAPVEVDLGTNKIKPQFGPAPDGEIAQRPQRCGWSNQEWAKECIGDDLSDGRRLWILTVVDTWIRVSPPTRIYRVTAAMGVLAT